MPHPLRRFFAYDHLPLSHLRSVSSLFHDLAWRLDEQLPDGAEKTVALRKLLESKDAGVRAALDIPTEG